MPKPAGRPDELAVARNLNITSIQKSEGEAWCVKNALHLFWAMDRPVNQEHSGESWGAVKQLLAVGVVIVFVGVLLTLIFHSKPVAVAYHRIMIRRSWKKVIEVGPTGHEQSSWIEAHEKHRDRLTDLGYFERKEFRLHNIEVQSEEFNRLWAELASTFPDCTTAQGSDNKPETPTIIEVWDVPGNMPKWESIINKHDRNN